MLLVQKCGTYTDCSAGYALYVTVMS